MPVFRGILLLLLAAAVACFVMYMVTRQAGWRVLGLRLMTWTVAAGLVFFAVLAIERLVV